MEEVGRSFEFLRMVKEKSNQSGVCFLKRSRKGKPGLGQLDPNREVGTRECVYRDFYLDGRRAGEAPDGPGNWDQLRESLDRDYTWYKPGNRDSQPGSTREPVDPGRIRESTPPGRDCEPGSDPVEPKGPRPESGI
ncbi:hypothetical protein L6452_19488 [Arctium lappa]|uniref:Uncharacterized protein n=1 Tax=Arctium lappa TaxID=4217 RepID=A0ACB9B8A3_ARCLA|nr:hypothetical protein L6452_19488 [Arctium lappa]